MSSLSIPLAILTLLYLVTATVFFIGLFFSYNGNSRKRYSVCVIVPARDEEDSIGECLSDLVNQTYPQGSYTIVVVDDGSEDRTYQIVVDFCRRYKNVRLINADETESGLSPKKNAMNTGIKKSREEIILTTDADCRVEKTWIESMVSYFDDDVGMVIGFSQYGDKEKNNRETLFEKIQALDFLALMSAAAGAANVGFPLAASAQNLGYRRKTFEEVGGFESIGNRVSGDDVLLLQLINKKTDCKIVFASSKGVYNRTSAEKTFKGFVSQRKRWASNAPYQHRLNKLFFLHLVVVFLLNLGLLLSVPSAVNTPLLSGGVALSHPLVCLAVKALADFAVIFKGGSVHGRLDLLKYFPLWFVLEIPYIVSVGIFGSLGGFSWKGRKHR